jgi:hypothetical protein
LSISKRRRGRARVISKKKGKTRLLARKVEL